MRRAFGGGQWSFIASRRNSFDGVLGVQRDLAHWRGTMRLEAGTLCASGQHGFYHERRLGDSEVVSEQSNFARCGVACSCGVAWISRQPPVAAASLRLVF